jgi:hypothetical protein
MILPLWLVLETRTEGVSTETNAGSQADTQHIKLTPEDNLPLLMYKFTLI